MLARNPTGSLVIYRLGAHERAPTARGGRRCSSTSCPLQLRRRQGQGRRHDDHRRDHVGALDTRGSSSIAPSSHAHSRQVSSIWRWGATFLGRTSSIQRCAGRDLTSPPFPKTNSALSIFTSGKPTCDLPSGVSNPRTTALQVRAAARRINFR